MTKGFKDFLKDLTAVKGTTKVPQYARTVPKKRDTTTANGLTSYILDYCKAQGIMAERITSEGRFRPGKTATNILGHTVTEKGTWLPGTMVGWPDVVVIIPGSGRFMGIEVKVGKDTQSEGQKKFQARCEAAGGLYYIVRTKEDFHKVIL